MWKQQKFRVGDHSQIGEIRRAAQGLAQSISFDEILTGKVSIVVTELATNVVKHGGGGEIILTVEDEAFHVLALDKGRGMSNVRDCLVDGFSTGGTAGNGLGAIIRGSSKFDLYTQPGKGTGIYAQFSKDSAVEKSSAYGVISLPYPGEEICGDGWAVDPEGKRFMVVDGLGHGLLAQEASSLAQQIFNETSDLPLEETIKRLHLGLRSSRGAAVSIMDLDFGRGLVNYCGVGNISGALIGTEKVKRCISHNGTVGVQLRKVQALPYPLDKNDGLVVVASDGLSTHWSLSDYPGLLHKEPLLVAGILYRDFGRNNDDVTVLAVRISP